MDVEEGKLEEELVDKPGTTIGTKFSVLHCIRIPFLMRCGFLTVDPFIRISVFIAKLSKRQYCWRVFEDFHGQEYTQFFDIHRGLLMRLHFSIGYYDNRRTTRLRQSIHFSRIQVLFADIMCIDAPESTTNSRSSGFRFDGAGRHQFSEGEKNVVFLFLL